MATQKQPVLILGVEPRITVPVARSLDGIGVPVAVASLSAHDLTLCSRAIFQFLRLPNYEKSPSEFITALSAFIRKHGFDTLIPVTDGALSVVSQNYDSLSDLLRLACPPARIIYRVLNKEETLAIATRCGIRVPREYAVSGLTEIGNIPDLTFPVVAKPRHKSAAEIFKVRYFHSEGELADAFKSGALDDVILQEYSTGQGVGVEVLYKNGECVAAFQHRRLKEVPHTGGAAAMAVAEPVDRELKNMALRLLAGLEWDGVAMVEFRHDPATGAAALMEVNGRYWGTVALAIMAGVDFPAYEWQLAHGITPAVPASYSVGVRWRWSAGLFKRAHGIIKSSRRVARAEKSSVDGSTSDRSAAKLTHDALWSSSDPLPAVLELLKTGKDLAVLDGKAVLKKMLPRRNRASGKTTSH
jgi:predicted ATP-grasp superfamily ATP-dependent carboligase